MRELAIAYGSSCKAKKWSNQTSTWQELGEKLKKTRRTKETVAEYQKMSQSDRANAKDKGGFVGGYLKDGRRQKQNVLCRSMLTLDVDQASVDFVANMEMNSRYAMYLYSTHSHTPEAPRIRVLVPLTRDVSPEEYVAISRYFAASWGIDQFDKCSFSVNQLMYWPTTPADGEYVFTEIKGEWLDPDTFLSRYPNWRDASQLPTTKTEKELKNIVNKKAEDPTAKTNIVGVFCRTYSISDVMDKFLSDVYQPADNASDRYIYTKGTGPAGVNVYDDKFAYSHHATDPAGGMNLNAFDLVRVHLFYDEDEKKSFQQMVEFAKSDEEVAAAMIEDEKNGLYTPYTRESPEDVFDVITDENDFTVHMKGISPETEAALKMTVEDAVSTLNEKLSADMALQEFYDESMLALLVKTEESAPHLYDVFRKKAKKAGASLATINSRFKDFKVKVEQAQRTLSTAKKAIPDFIVYNPTRECFEISCPKLAAYVRKNLKYKLAQDHSNKLGQIFKYVFQDGKYILCKDELLKGHIKQFIADYDESLISMRVVDEVFKQLVTDLDIIGAEKFDSDMSIINLEDGILNLDTMELQPHSSDILSTVQIACRWNAAELATPVFDGYLDTLTNEDKEVQELILQFMGLILSNVPCWKTKKALFLVGDGNSGKSVIKSLIEKMLGLGNYTSIDLATLEARFGTASIYGKRLAGSSDMKFMRVQEVETFKKCTGGDSLFAENKGEAAFNFVFNGALMFCANKLPKFGGDQGDWVYDRMMIIECNNVIPEEQRDSNLLDKLYKERSGILRKAVDAFLRLRENGYRFKEPSCVLDCRRQYKSQNNFAVLFFEEHMRKRPTFGRISDKDTFTVKRVYETYRAMCKDDGNSYYCTLEEFKQYYAEFCKIPRDKCICIRDGKKFFMEHELTPECYAEHRGYGDPLVKDRYPETQSQAVVGA